MLYPERQLHSLKEVVFAQNKKMAEAFVRITNKIETVRGNFSVSKLRNFLISECGLNRADVNMYMKFERTIGDYKETITDNGLPVTVVKALFNAPEAVRVEAMQHVEAGSFLHSSDISAIKRRQRDEATDPAVLLEQQRMKALRESVQRKAQIELETFSERFIFFAQLLIDFFNDAQEEQVDFNKLSSRRTRLQEEAGRCLEEFEAVFDTKGVPPAWEYDFHGHDTQRFCCKVVAV